MTARDILKKQAHLVALISITSAAILIGSFLGAAFYSPFFWGGVLLAGILQAFVLPAAVSALRCPWCRAPLGSLLDWWFKLDGVRFCPRCGRSLDDDLAEGKKAADELA